VERVDDGEVLDKQISEHVRCSMFDVRCSMFDVRL